jgi:hypothetical protein
METKAEIRVIAQWGEVVPLVSRKSLHHSLSHAND